MRLSAGLGNGCSACVRTVHGPDSERDARRTGDVSRGPRVSSAARRRRGAARRDRRTCARRSLRPTSDRDAATRRRGRTAPRAARDRPGRRAPAARRPGRRRRRRRGDDDFGGDGDRTELDELDERAAQLEHAAAGAVREVAHRAPAVDLHDEPPRLRVDLEPIGAELVAEHRTAFERRDHDLDLTPLRRAGRRSRRAPRRRSGAPRTPTARARRRRSGTCRRVREQRRTDVDQAREQLRASVDGFDQIAAFGSAAHDRRRTTTVATTPASMRSAPVLREAASRRITSVNDSVSNVPWSTAPSRPVHVGTGAPKVERLAANLEGRGVSVRRRPPGASHRSRAGRPDHRSTCSAAWWTSMPSPSTTWAPGGARRPRAAASRAGGTRGRRRLARAAARRARSESRRRPSTGPIPIGVAFTTRSASATAASRSSPRHGRSPPRERGRGRGRRRRGGR